MKILLLLLLFFTSLTVFSQEFSFEMYFEDAKGNKDTLIFGYDETATDTVDAQFGEVEYFGTKMEKEFEVFVSPSWEQRYKPQYTFLKKQIEQKKVGGSLIQSILVKGENYPITISWDSTLFIANDIYKSVLTDWNPGGWFDASYGHEIGIFNLIRNSEVIFPYLGQEDIIVQHFNETDTFRLVYFAFSTEGYVGIKQTTKENLRIYPNPALNQFTVKLPSNNNLEKLQIFSITGELIKESFDLNMDISAIKSGIYVVKVHVKDGRNTLTSLLKIE